jgi:hypothetical protein
VHRIYAPIKQHVTTPLETQMLKGLGNLGDMAGMMKKAQEMQTKMA